MYYLARLTSSSSHSLAATIGYAMSGTLGWRASMEPGEGIGSTCVRFPAKPPAVVSRSEASDVQNVQGALSPVSIVKRRIVCTDENS